MDTEILAPIAQRAAQGPTPWEATSAPSLAGLVGNTPLIRLHRLTAHLPREVSVWVKAEWLNPSGSVKDRPALNILRNALAAGQLARGRALLDSTSGNMGTAYATLSRALGVPVRLVMPANASPERQAILRALGAEVTLTSPLEGSDGAQRAAEEIAAAEPGRYYYANQYDHPANWLAHYRTTGPEIWAQTQGAVTHFVAGLGTTGTFTGTGRALRARNPDIRLIAVQPDAPFHGLEGLKHLETARVPAIFDPGLVDRHVGVSTEAAHAMARRLAGEEGLFVGVSAAAAAVAAMRLAEGLAAGTVVAIFPDGGARYASDPFWQAGSIVAQER